MKEIVFVSNFFGDGGAARVISVLAETLSNKGYDVTIISYPLKSNEYAHSDKIKHIHLHLKNHGNRRETIERIKLLRSELKKHHNAIIVSFEYFMNMQTILACFGLKNRLIVSERNDPKRMGGKFPTSVIRNFLYLFIDELVCQTPDAKSYFPPYIQRKTKIIPNPVKDDLPEKFNGIRKHRIVNFCRLEKQKNLILLIDAFSLFQKKYPDYYLEIYGDGEQEELLRLYIKDRELSDSVSIFHSIPNIHEIVIDSAMFVSSSDYEGLSNSMLEAMALGLPTICTDCPCGGARMVIQNEINGLLVPTNDCNELYHAMERIAENMSFAKKLSDNAYRIRENLATTVIVMKWEELF